MDISMEDLKKLDDREVTELNRTLGIKVLKRFALIFGIKWALIIGISYIGKKLAESDKNA